MKPSKEEVLKFFTTLSTQDITLFTKEDYKKISAFIKSDGCTFVPDIYIEACYEHDFYYYTHLDFYGNPISRSEADKRFREAKQRFSRLGKGSPLSWWRWVGVRLGGWILW